MVGLGAVNGPSAALRERCGADLRTLVPSPTPDRPRRDRCRWTTGSARCWHSCRELPVVAELTPCTVPAPVADAIADSARAALSNVVRHAPGAAAILRLARAAGTVVVEVTDDGPGFDPATVPGHRYGLRESVRGRMAGGGGRVDVSAPGDGTRIRLEWSDVD